MENEKILREKEIEKNFLIEIQNQELEKKVLQRTSELNKSLESLKSTQSQLIQSEKMASLGQLTAGIAHEIQNPLNFVNNFGEINNELIEELQNSKNQSGAEQELLSDIYHNNEKIVLHGKRADAIVKNMLQHSRSSGGIKELTDINALADEYLRLAYHGVRSKNSSFSVNLETDFDSSIEKINIIPQDIGRVLLNLYNNAFDAVNVKNNILQAEGKKFEGVVSVETIKQSNKITISITDNGNGIPQNIIDKIFQPFFTTKPTGQGTGLGLSLSYDIIKAHCGEIKVTSMPIEGTEFTIELPIVP
ncbi:MAG: ATP-binding protein [Chitinophagaceae bacterium]